MFTATEGTTAAIITVGRSGDPTVQVLVDYATADGTATAPGRYTSTSGTLTFAPGVVTRTFAVPDHERQRAGGERVVARLPQQPGDRAGFAGPGTIVGTNPATSS